MRSEGGLAYLTADEMADADRAAIEEFGVDVLSLMENAGVAVARLARRMLGGSVSGRRVCCLVGKGNNGGDGLVAARHLSNWGAIVNVATAGDRSELHDIPARQMEIVDRMGVQVGGAETDLRGAELLVDALLGYGSKGDPRGPVAELILKANAAGIPIVSVDIPSGMDATTGKPGNPCIVATATVTLGLPKTGFLNPEARRFIGELYVADISVPRAVYARYSQGTGLFREDALVRVW